MQEDDDMQQSLPTETNPVLAGLDVNVAAA